MKHKMYLVTLKWETGGFRHCLISAEKYNKTPDYWEPKRVLECKERDNGAKLERSFFNVYNHDKTKKINIRQTSFNQRIFTKTKIDAKIEELLDANLTSKTVITLPKRDYIFLG